jgi:RNA polymerase sigma factor (sigma-70 family)
VIAIPAHAPERERQVIGLAAVTAQRWYDRGDVVDNEDILGAALLGAAKALDRYDEARGVGFASYAIRIIKAEIQEELRRWDHLTRPGRTKARAQEQETGERPAWGVPPLRLGDVIPLDGTGESGYAEITLQDTLIDAGEDPEALALARLQRDECRRRLSWLPARERRLIEWRYYEEEKMLELRAEFGCSESRMHQIHNQALSRLREWSEEETR